MQSSHFNIFGIKYASERYPLRKIMSNRDCWNVYRFSCFFQDLFEKKVLFTKCYHYVRLTLRRITTVTQQTFVGLQDVKPSHVNTLSPQQFFVFQDVFKTKTSCKDILKTSWKTRAVTLMTSSRCLQHISRRCLQDVLETNKMFTGDICSQQI